MKRLFTLICLAAVAVTFASCSYDDDDLWNKVNDIDDRITALESDMNSEITALKALINALDSGYAVSEVAETSDGYAITLSDGTTITIKHGSDGESGVSGGNPVVGVDTYSDGKYYWTITIDGVTDWLTDGSGNMIPVNGENGSDGNAGADGSTPVMGVDAQGYWTVTVGGTTQRVKDSSGNDVKAVGSDGDSSVRSVEITESYVKIYLASGGSLTLPIANFTISIDADSLETFAAAEQRGFNVTMTNIDEYVIFKPYGWKASVTGGTLTVTSPVAGNTDAETDGTVSITVVSQNFIGIARFDVIVSSSAIPDDSPAAAIAADGFYVVNEDWFGHDNGTVNYFGWEGSMIYRAYRAANSGASFGVTTPYGTIYGDNAYFVSKQGNRLVVADAATLVSKAVFTDIGGGDGRAFVGATPKKGYISTSAGVTVFDIENMSVGSAVSGISAETGNMIYAGGYVFAAAKSTGIYAIDVETDQIYSLTSGDFGMMTQSKDGNIWAADTTNKTFTVINPYTFEVATVSVSGMSISSTWSAWNPGSLCASTAENAIYWINGGAWSLGTVITKYDIDNATATDIHTLGTDDAGIALKFYGAGMRVDPLTDKLVVTLNRGSVGYNYTYTYVIDNTGNVVQKYSVGDDGVWGLEGAVSDTYYWFPSMPIFKDVNDPQILLNNIVVDAGDTVQVDLNKKIVDADNASATIDKRISDLDETLVSYSLSNNVLTVSAGSTNGTSYFTITAVSNGKKVQKSIKVDVL